MFDNLKNLASLMGQAKEMRAKMEQMQAELARQTVQADAGAGAVRVTMNGKFEVVNLEFEPSMIATLAGAGAQADRQMVEELVLAALAAAHAKVRELLEREMSQMTGGLDLKGFEGLLR